MVKAHGKNILLNFKKRNCLTINLNLDNNCISLMEVGSRFNNVTDIFLLWDWTTTVMSMLDKVVVIKQLWFVLYGQERIELPISIVLSWSMVHQ